jgi:hypothetical protein
VESLSARLSQPPGYDRASISRSHFNHPSKKNPNLSHGIEGIINGDIADFVILLEPGPDVQGRLALIAGEGHSCVEEVEHSVAS